MLSCFSTESDMVHDHFMAIQNLTHIYVHLASDATFAINVQQWESI